MRWFAFLSGCAATASALIVVAALPAGSTPSAEVIDAVQPAAVVQLSPIVRSVESTPADLPGLDPAVAALLGDTGHASFASLQDLAGLDPVVVQTLISQGAVLVLPENQRIFGGS